MSENVISIITDNYHKIHNAERKVADYILASPNNVIHQNVSEVARNSDVSEATVIRFCKHLGFNGFYNLKICLSKDIGNNNDVVELAEDLSDTSLMFNNLADMIRDISNHISSETIQEAVDIIANSKMVHIIGIGNTATLSMYTGFRLERLGIRASYNLQEEYFMNHLNLAKEDECIIAISWSGVSKSVVMGLEMAKEKGMKSISITGYPFSPVSKLTDVLLLTAPERSVGTKNSQYSRLAEMAVLEVLFYSLDKRLEKNTGDRLEELQSEKKY